MECGSSAPAFAICTARNMTSTIANPLALIAELTHRCPLHCVYCSNPLELTQRPTELPIEDWSRVFQEAAALGVLQADFTGGEPLTRPDVLELIRAARSAGLYVNLITSGLPLDESRLEALVAAGLDHFQLSFQGAREEIAQEISGTKAHAQKLRVLEWLKRHHVAVTLNFVIHRRNIDQLPRNARSRRIFQRQPRRVRERSILRLGFRQPRFPSAGPTTRAPLKIEEFSAIAFGKSSLTTISTRNACRIGTSNAFTTPTRNAMRISSHT